MANNWSNKAAKIEGRKVNLNREGITRAAATLGTSTSYGQELLFPEQYKQQPDDTYDAATISQFDTTLPWDVLNFERNAGRIKSKFDLTQAELRHTTQSKMRERLGSENMIEQMLYGMPFELLNPYNYPELMLAATTGGTSLAMRLSMGGVANAATAYTSESAIQSNNAYNDEGAKNMAGLMGFAFGSAAWGAFGKSNKMGVGDLSVAQIESRLVGTVVKVDGTPHMYVRDGEVEAGDVVAKLGDDATLKGESPYKIEDAGEGSWIIKAEQTVEGQPQLWANSKAEAVPKFNLVLEPLAKNKEWLQVTTSNVAVNSARKGVGTAMYKEAFKLAASKGKKLVSDESVSDAAIGVYKKLEKEGYTITWNKTIKREKTDGPLKESRGEFQNVTTDRGPVAIVESGPKAKSASKELSGPKDTTLKLKKIDEKDVPEQAKGLGRYLKMGMMAKMRGSKSGIERTHAEAFDVVGNSQGLNTKDTAVYIKELHQRNHMDSINQLTGIFNTNVKKSVDNTLTIEQWNREVKNQFDRLRNGHAVSAQYKDAVGVVTKWADTQKKYMTEAGYKTLDNWTPRAYNESKIRAMANEDIGGLYNSFKNAALSRLKQKEGKTLDAKRVKAEENLVSLKQRYRIEEEAIVTRLVAEAKQGKGKLKGLLNKKGVPVVSKHPTLKALRGKMRYQESIIKKKGDADKLEKQAEKTSKKFVDNFMDRDREMMEVDMLKERSYDFDESMLSNLMHQDMTKLMMHTANATAGRMATKKRFGISSKSELDEAKASYKSELRAEGALSEREINKALIRFEKGIKSTWGSLMRAENPDSGTQLLKRFLLNSNFATMGGGFAATTLQGEAAILLMSGSLKASLSGMGIGFREFRNTFRGMPPKSEYAHQLQIMTYAYDVNTHSTLGRFVDGDHDPTVYRGNKVGDKAVELSERSAELVGKYSGLTPVTSSLRMALGHIIIQDLFKTPMHKLMKDVKKYDRLQVDLSKIAEIRRIDKEKGIFQYNKDGSIKDINLEKLPRDLQNMIERGVSNASRLNILTGDKMHLPSIYSDPDNVMVQYLLQFTSFPVQAMDSLLVRGLDENKAKFAVALATGALVSSTFAMSREQMQISMGSKRESDRKYDPTTKDGLTNLGINAYKKGSLTAPIALFHEYLSKGLTGEGIGSDYQQRGLSGLGGPTASKLGDIATSMQQIDFNPMDGNSNAWKTVYGRTLMLNSFLPLYTLPLIGDVFRDWNKRMANNTSYTNY